MSDSPLTRNIDAAVAAFQNLAPMRAALEHAAALTLDALLGGRKLLVCGNGGSAADAMHLATEFVCRFTTDRRPYPALCLNSSGGDLTAIGNDYGCEHLFARQVRAFGQPGDVLIVFSSSGASENVRLAVDQANELGLESIAMLGRGGGVTRGRATVDLIVPSQVTARVQEAQKLLLHTLCEMVDDKLPRA